jgi:hypothetical protein
LDLGRVAVFGLVLAAGLDLVAGLDLAFRDGDLARLTVPALDLVFALLLVFAAALTFADFVFFLATMCAPSAPNDSQPCRVATPITKPQPRSMDRREWRSKYTLEDCIIHRTTPKRYGAGAGVGPRGPGPSARAA